MSSENDHNVYVLGAGFSADANMPLMSGGSFFARMQSCLTWLEQQHRMQEAKSVQKVIKFSQRAKSAAYWIKLEFGNIEELFSLSSASSIGLDPKDVRRAIAATLDYSSEERKEKGNYYSYVGSLLGMPSNFNLPCGRNTFITFNYDTVLENALHDRMVSFSYGFKKNSVTYDSTFVRKGVKREVDVLKLHGSVNWLVDGDALRVFGSYSDVRRSGGVPELIPPTWKKVGSSQLDSVWEQAVRSLTSANRLIVIGFSMPPTDMHFKYLLAAGFQENTALTKVIFLDPDAQKIEAKGKELFQDKDIQSGKVSFKKTTLGELADSEEILKEIGRPKLGRIFL
jgi:hypothetical protein